MRCPKCNKKWKYKRDFALNRCHNCGYEMKMTDFLSDEFSVSIRLKIINDQITKLMKLYNITDTSTAIGTNTHSQRIKQLEDDLNLIRMHLTEDKENYIANAHSILKIEELLKEIISVFEMEACIDTGLLEYLNNKKVDIETSNAEMTDIIAFYNNGIREYYDPKVYFIVKKESLEQWQQTIDKAVRKKEFFFDVFQKISEEIGEYLK